jgi:thiamine biosynthesis lipoprotein
MKRAEPGGAGVAPGEARPGSRVHRFAHEAMATVFEVLCAHDDAGYARQAAHAAFLLVDRLEQELSRFVANSDVSRINALAAGQDTRVSPSTLECLEIAQGLFEVTGGAFDVAIATGLDRLELVPEAFLVRAREGGARIDLGGIGKGYAVDRMAELLVEWGIGRALVHGGRSSVVALEPPPGTDGWPLTLSAPWPGDERVLVRLETCRRALSASGTRKGDHIVDPRTRRAVRGRAAWVALSGAVRPELPAQASTETEARGSPAAVAEGLSTAFTILPTREIEDLSRRWPGLEAWLAPEPSEADAPPPTLVHLAGPPAAGPGTEG